MKAILAKALVSMLIVISFAGMVTANPIWLGEVPPDADTKPPYIIIFSPENNSQINSSISINLKAGVGESKTAAGSVIESVSYKADWIENNITLYKDSSTGQTTHSQAHIFYVTVLNLSDIPQGNHSIVIYAVENGSYEGKGTLEYYSFHIQNSATFSFSNNIQASPSPSVPEFSWLTILPILLTITIALVMFRKRLQRNV
jgi:hypothetical protein